MSEALKDAILTGKPDRVVSEHVLERVPFIFNNDWDSFRNWRSILGEKLGIDPREITLTGSACVGFSLSPKKNLRPFTDQSDIDVAIVSEWHFSEAWHALRQINIGVASLTPPQRAALSQIRDLVYFGCVATDRVLSLLPFAAQWLAGLSHMASIAPTVGRNINARIYKDFRALSSYQALSVKQLRDELLSTK